MKVSVYEQCLSKKDDIIQIRRKLHQIPEVGIYNPETSAFICRELERMGIPFQISHSEEKGVKNTSIVGLIRGKKEGITVALRADLDGLPIAEENEVPYKSTHQGKMHACGHDCHMAILLGAAEILKKHEEEMCGSVKLIFQTGEEELAGARMLMSEEVMRHPDVSACFGLHVWPIPEYPAGALVIAPGCVMAAGDRFDILIKGKGSHGSQPSFGIDPVTCAAQIISALQLISSREVSEKEKGVLSVCRIHAGSAWNVIPSEAHLQGTIRTISTQTRQHYKKRINEIVKQTAGALRCIGEVEWSAGTPAVDNDAETAKRAADAAGKLFEKEFVIDHASPFMATEDFAFYQQEVPGVYAFLNISDSGSAAGVSLHNSRFQVDESVLWHGTAYFVQTVLDWLGTGQN